MKHLYGVAAALAVMAVVSPAMAQDSFGGQQPGMQNLGQPQQGAMPGMQPMGQMGGGQGQMPGMQPEGGMQPGMQGGMMGQQPGAMGMQPGGMGQQPGMSQQGMQGQQPGMMGQQPGMMGQQPGMVGQQPGMMGQQPGIMGQQPGLGGQPAMPGQQPGMMGQQPGFAMPGGAGQVQPGMAGQMPAAGGDPLDALAEMERRDFGVQATQQLHSGPFHSPTPNQIPGGQLITTKGLVSLIQNQQIPKLVFDILGGPEHLPGAIPAVAASQPGTFQDQTERSFGQYLSQATQGNKQVPLVFYCLSTECWMSYNASLRAIALGYTNVLWYRGGIEAWKTAGLPTQR